MKTEIKALPLSFALSFLALLGACSSVNSTPNSEVPNGDNSVILEDTGEGVESVEDLSSDNITGDATTETETLDGDSAEVEPIDGMSEDSAEIEPIDGMSEDSAEVEPIDGMSEDSAEVEPIDGMSEDSAEVEPIDGMSEDSAVDSETIDGDSAEVEPIDGMSEDSAVDSETIDGETAEETDPTEIILPEGDSAEVETDSEAAETVIPETEPQQY